MGKVSEKDIAAFAVEFVNKICEINERYIIQGRNSYRLMWGKKEILLYDIYSGKLTADGILENCQPTEMSVNEFTENRMCIAYLTCEGDLYEKMYYYESMGAGGALMFYEIDND